MRILFGERGGGVTGNLFDDSLKQKGQKEIVGVGFMQELETRLR